MTGPALFLSGPEFEMFERREKDFPSLIQPNIRQQREILSIKTSVSKKFSSIKSEVILRLLLFFNSSSLVLCSKYLGYEEFKARSDEICLLKIT